MFSEEELERYSRHLILDGVGEEGLASIKEASVLVIGAGGLGCPVLQYLAAAGVGTIAIVDDDVVSLSNLQRQVIYHSEDLGSLKAEVAGVRLRRMNPHIVVSVHIERLELDRAIGLFPNFDIVVDCTDSFQSRYMINDAAVITGKPFVSASLFRYEGQLSVFNYGNGPTYRCLFPDEKSLGFGCNETGILGALTGIMGSYQAMEVLKIILGRGEVLSGKVKMINVLTNSHYLLEVERNQNEVDKVVAKLQQYNKV